MVDRGDVWSGVTDLMGGRIVLVVAGELGHVSIEGCRKQESLGTVGGLIENAPNGGQESHIGHTVGFVYDHLIHFTEVHCVLADQVFEPPRAGDQDVDALFESLDLVAV